MRSAITAALLVAAMAGTAAAQPGVTSPTAAPVPPTQPNGDELSETTALWLSLGGTAAAWTVLLVGVELKHQGYGSAGAMEAIGGLGTLLAPSLGHWYAGALGGRGLGLRAAGAGAAYLGLVLVAACEDECSTGPAAAVLLLVGAGLYLGGTIDSIATAPGAARRQNHRFQNVAIVPMIRGDRGGMAIVGRF